MQFSDFVNMAFMGIISSGVLIGVKTLINLSKTIAELNSKIAVVIEKMAWHEQWLVDHDNAINDLKKHKPVTRE